MEFLWTVVGATLVFTSLGIALLNRGVGRLRIEEEPVPEE
jgi:hypothetical protein